MSKRSAKRIDEEIKKPKLEEIKDVSNIPHDCLAEIFMYLNVFDRIAIEEVCSTWKFICKTMAWHDVKIFKCSHSLGRSIDNRRLEQTDIIKLLPYCSEYLRHLKLSGICDSSIMLNVGVFCPKLAYLEIEIPFDDKLINADYYEETFVKLTNLRTIKIKDSFNMKNIYPAFPLKVIDYLPEEVDNIFVSLYYPQNNEPNYKVSFPTLEKFKRLRRLHLKHWILRKNLLQIIGTKKTLVHLTLLDCRISQCNIPLLLSELENLEYLEVSGGWNIESMLNGISIKCKNLKQLKLRRYNMHYSSVFEEILQLYNLECLVLCDVQNFDNNYIIKITENLKKLKTLEFGFCDNFKNDTFQQLGQLPELEHLSLTSTFNESVIPISNNCNKLKTFSLFHSSGNSSALCEIEKFKYLETLHLYDVENVNDDVIISIANQCKNLKSLKINFTTELTAIGIQEIEKLENLECLELKHVENITDVVLNRKYKLKSFKCFVSTNFTDQGLIMLLKNCQNLEILMINSVVFTDQVLLCAIEETKKRTNNILLTIIAIGESRNDMISIINSSPLLEYVHRQR